MANSRAMSSPPPAYAVFAMVKPRHLGAAMTKNPIVQPQYDLVSTTTLTWASLKGPNSGELSGQLAERGH